MIQVDFKTVRSIYSLRQMAADVVIMSSPVDQHPIVIGVK